MPRPRNDRDRSCRLLSRFMQISPLTLSSKPHLQQYFCYKLPN
ncbi:UNVERIFIED_CONTAM: hypothetical protein GTU68_023848 [Idotea baltica]|nr:hypothetical protein [Idotea baltica]